MVDPIDVEIEEIKTNTVRTNAQLDMLMRDWTRPETKSQMLAGLPGSSVKGGASDKGSNRILDVATGMILVTVIKDLTKKSTILSTMFDSVAKLLGFLTDMILLPFLPLLVGALMGLYYAIMLFAQLNPLNPSNNPANSYDEGTKWANEFMKGLTAGLLDTTQFLALAGAIAVGITAAILGAPAWAATIAAIIVAEIIGALVPQAIILGDKFQGWLTSMHDKFWYFVNEFTAKFGQTFNDIMTAVDTFVTSIKNGFISLINSIISTINTVLPSGMKIGTIGGTTATSDKGLIAGAAESAGGNTYQVNVTGLTQDQLPDQILNALRSFGAAYMK